LDDDGLDFEILVLWLWLERFDTDLDDWLLLLIPCQDLAQCSYGGTQWQVIRPLGLLTEEWSRQWPWWT
jgi:hypothetical protein